VTIWFRSCASFEEEAEADREYWQRFSSEEKVAQMEELRDHWAQVSNESQRPNRDHVRFLAALARHDVRALIVGAHALAFHAKPRYTKDLDLFVEATPENAARVLAALDEFGFGALGLTIDDLAERGRSVQLGFEPNRIDVRSNLAGISFSEAWANRAEGTFGGQVVAFIGRAELMRNKAASARPQDLADLDLLRRFAPPL
jgi:hypothetical protein